MYMDRNLNNFRIAVLKNHLYVISSSTQHATVERLDLITITWTQVRSMNMIRQGLGVAVMGGMLYDIGGIDEDGALNTVER